MTTIGTASPGQPRLGEGGAPIADLQLHAEPGSNWMSPVASVRCLGWLQTAVHHAGDGDPGGALLAGAAARLGEVVEVKEGPQPAASRQTATSRLIDLRTGMRGSSHQWANSRWPAGPMPGR